MSTSEVLLQRFFCLIISIKLLNGVSLELSRIEEVFFPETHLAKNKALSSGMKFVYYTTAEVAYQVITDQRIWMRNTSTMNDYMEIDYGQKLVLNAYEAVSGANLKVPILLFHVFQSMTLAKTI